MMRMGFRPIVLAVMLMLALGSAAACSAVAPAGLPDGVDVSVHQNRPDTADRRLQVRISNDTDAPITVTELAFDHPGYSEPAPYPKVPTEIRAGGVIDLPVALTDPVCDAADGAPVVRLDYTTADGVSASATVTPGDTLHQLDGILQRDCLEQTIASIADIVEPDDIRTEVLASRLVALVDLAIVPTGASGSFTLASVDDTVLFGIFSHTSPAPLTSLQLGIEVRGDAAPQTVTIPLVPARCDPHAVAEDKRGTLLPLRVQVSDVTGIRYFALSDQLKGQLYSYVAVACGHPAG